MQQVGTTGKESSKKHATEGLLSTPRRTRRLKEKQIKPKGLQWNNKGLAQKALPSTTLAQKTDETPKAQDKPPKKKRFQAKKYKQTSIVVTKQIESESIQLLWKEKPAKEATAKKLIAQFGFVGDPTLSKRHNASITLGKKC